ncbi:MAG: hypothetical protein KGJ09_05455 [Candidatus Omnitrophica bacterium]|nr:hypothetical protein [Candidatus Omnitrophota bacterium]MDE2009510.1 hypothetical protein [Candidatus Omnitrophota bacterium]MDE2215451.1 hypothetical protein [Candidatus Omnitrophota bacterium]MDE2231631.1 hypothetical protein [Candidatus Omnitrophota bacterium]
MNVRDTKAQSTIEFTFAVVVIMFIVYGLVMVFRWAGLDLANRRVAQDISLTKSLDPSNELNSQDDYYFLPMSAVYHGSITNGNSSQ